MPSLFELDAFLDPTSPDEPASSFLSFSSFADLANTAMSPYDFASWDHGLEAHLIGKKIPTHPPSSQPPSDSALSDTSSPRDPFSIVEAAFETNGPVGIFVGSAPVRKLAESVPTTASSYRSSSSSTDGWDEPITPGLSARTSIESFTKASTVHPGAHKQAPQPYSWDDASTGMGTASGYTHVPHRVVSQPILNRNQPRVPRPMTSMPCLKEEDTPSAWFDGTEQIDPALVTPTGSASLAQPNGASSLQVTTDLSDDFEWVFGEYGLGAVDASQNNMYAAYQTEEPISSGPSSADSTRDMITALVQQTMSEQQSWLPSSSSSQNAGGQQSYNNATMASLPNFTVDTMAILGPTFAEDDISRPSTAPGLNTGDSQSHLLNIPLADAMTRSVSSDCLPHSRQNQPKDLFSYTPQAIPTGPPVPQPLYTTTPSVSFTHEQRNPGYARRASTHNLSVQIQQMPYSSYSPVSSGSVSATFGDFSSQQSQPWASVGMTRAGTQPLPTTRRLSTSESLPMVEGRIPAHVARAQAMIEMQEARHEAQRQEMRRMSSARQVSMANQSNGIASLQQPEAYAQSYQVHPPPQRQSIMGWEGPSAQTAALPVLTTTPLVTVHPPSGPYVIRQGVSNGSPMKIHPPPHPGMTTRPLANLPITPPRQRKASGSPNKRTPKKRQGQTGGGFSWGETTFINFTSDDAEKLLTGVAPSGSQGKRKREEGMNGMNGEEGVEMARERSKRSRSDD